MVDFTINYENGDTKDKTNRACFGCLDDQHGDWDYEGVEIESITYKAHKDSLKHLDARISWLENHPLFGQAINSIHVTKYRVKVDVCARHPADLVLGTLSVARCLFGENRKSKRKNIVDYYDALGDMDLAFALAEFNHCDHWQDGDMFVEMDESVVPDFTLAKYIEWYNDPTCNGSGIEKNYSSKKTYSSVKTALTGKARGKYNYRNKTMNKPQFLEMFRYEVCK